MSNDESSPLDMWRKVLSHPKVQANPGAKQYVQDQVELMARRLPTTDAGAASNESELPRLI
jgi:hypothetical protein